MAFYDTTWYCNAGDQSTTGHYAVTKWAAGATIAAGVLRRQLAAPAVNNERVFAAVVGGTTGGTEPTWVLTRGAKTTDNTVTWQEVTGASAVNGDATNTSTWTQAKAIGTPTLGAIIKRNNGASYWICSTAGTLGASEPAWPNDTAGTTQADGTTTWTCLGVVGNFTGGQAPHARLANACANSWFIAGNTIYVGDNHAESQATAIGIAPAGGAGLICKILCHNHSGSYPPASSDLRTGAVLSNTGNVTLSVNPASALYAYGLTFKAGIGQSSGSVFIALQNSNVGNQATSFFDNCSFQLFTTGAAYIQIGATGTPNNIIFNNCTVYFAATTQFISTQLVDFVWRNTGSVLASGSSVPANFILPQVSALQNTELEALDLNQLTGIIFANAGASPTMGKMVIKDCKLNAAALVSSPISSDMVVQLVRSDSGATAYKSARYQYEGTETTETSITRVGGASDPNGQAQSRKIVTMANSQWLRPFKAEPYAIWNLTTGANVTVTVYGTINAGALPNNDDIWLEVEYLGSSATPLGTIVTTTKANVLASGSAVASDASTWNGGGSGTGWSPFKLTTTLSAPQPGMAGYLHARVRAAKASTTYYIDPKIVLS